MADQANIPAHSPGQQGGNKNQQATNTPAPFGDGGPSHLHTVACNDVCGHGHIFRKVTLGEAHGKIGSNWPCVVDGQPGYFTYPAALPMFVKNDHGEKITTDGEASETLQDLGEAVIDRVEAEAENKQLREIVVGLLKMTDRLPPWEKQDHACAECFPEGDLIVNGFRCAIHAARKAVGQ